MKTIYFTGKGDDGTSGLFGIPNRFPKDDVVFDLLGTLDELNSWLGLCKASCNNFGSQNSQRIKTTLEQTQKHIFIIQAEIAGSEKKLLEIHLREIEKSIINNSEHLTPSQHFYIPGGCVLSSFLDVTRTIARRCERIFLKAQKKHSIQNYVLLTAYLNRLSSLLYVLVRFVNQEKNIPEKSPHYNT